MTTRHIRTRNNEASIEIAGDRNRSVELIVSWQSKQLQLPVRLRLDPPIDYDGKQCHEIIAGFDKLIGKDLQRCEREFTHQYKADRNETPAYEMKQLVSLHRDQSCGRRCRWGWCSRLPRGITTH